MAPTAARPTTKKRNRKRKRRIASSSSESSSSDDSSSVDSVSSAQRSKVTQKHPQSSAPPAGKDDPSSSSSSSSSSAPSSSSDDDSEVDDEKTEKAASLQPDITAPSTKEPTLPARDSPSPPPPSVVAIPPFINPGSPEDELALKEKFRRFWMASLAEGFKDDLEVIRKEPNLGQSRLALLIESLAAGADVFSSTSTDGNVNEMEVVVDELS
ncbi:hypothetical protein EDD16DRAFT_1569993 [Pisolithus croceorrhizus]|nr:hypothetical protein EDD16DRAFT_1569993 [Pisolithus croceorrhizus]